jgi:hypothetical protein
MLDLDTELGSLVKEELQRGFYAQAVNAKARQLRIAQANARLEHAHIEGVGQHVASIDAFAFIDWERRNPGITRDKDWLKSLLRDNPECRVQTSSAKTQVSFAGMDFNPSENTGICPDTVSSDSVFSDSASELKTDQSLKTENSAA